MADDNGPAMTITMVVCAAASLIFMSLRFYCKQALSTKVGLDDIVLGFSWILFLVFIVISIYTTKLGLGKHLDANFDMTQLPNLLYLLPIGQFFAVIAVAVSKSSFILTLLRLVTKPWQKAALWFMFATINASMLSISIVQFFQCAAPGQQHCVPGDAVIGLGVFAAGYSAALDLVLTLFPSLVIWKLQMQTREKVGVITSMSLGVVAGVVGIYKTSTIPYVSRSADFTYGTAIVLIWVVAEVTATIIAASLPFFRPLIRRVSSTKGKAGSSPSFGMSRMGNHSRHNHSKLGSQADVKGGDMGYDYSSERDMLPPNARMVLKTNEITVEYDSASADEELGELKGHGKPGRRDMF